MRSIPRLFFVVLLVVHVLEARADTYPRQTGIDALHYVFRLRLTDSSNEIAGETTITVRVTEPGVKEVSI
jgi:hypothetical protein